MSDTPDTDTPNDDDIPTPGDDTSDAPNRMVEENGVDLDALSDTGPNQQGNAYGVSREAAEAYLRERNERLGEMRAEMAIVEAERDKWKGVVEGLVHKDVPFDPPAPKLTPKSE